LHQNQRDQGLVYHKGQQVYLELCCHSQQRFELFHQGHQMAVILHLPLQKGGHHPQFQGQEHSG
jgi:hypothetical protein